MNIVSFLLDKVDLGGGEEFTVIAAEGIEDAATRDCPCR